jgi:hypothetical protein
LSILFELETANLSGKTVAIHRRDTSEGKMDEFTSGREIVYDDGRPGHQGVKATILSADDRGMVVQFVDRADTTAIRFTDDEWMSYITVRPLE